MDAPRPLAQFPIEYRCLGASGPTLAELADAERTAPAPCPTCRTGCGCNLALGDMDCGHYACWGRAWPADDPITPCPGVAYELAREAALRGRG